VNAAVAERRRLRLEREAREESDRIKAELEAAEEEKRRKIEAANRVIEAETEAIENRIQAEDLERAIEAALQVEIIPPMTVAQR
jgi:hypothetical protein